MIDFNDPMAFPVTMMGVLLVIGASYGLYLKRKIATLDRIIAEREVEDAAGGHPAE